MACKCEKCGLITTCGEKYCSNCFIDECIKEDTDKNLFAGGRFFGEKLERRPDELQRQR